MRIAYIGIDFLSAALHALLESGCEVEEIFTCRTDNKTEFNTEIVAIAEQKGIPCKMDPITVEDLKRLEQKGVELILCAGYYHKVPIKSVIPLVNVHPALLPVGRGAWPMPVTILKGLSESGVTFHKMTEEMDRGDIILQKSFRVSRDEDLKSFMRKVSDAIREVIPVLLQDFNSLYRNALPQGDGEYWKMPTKEDWTVTPLMSLEEMDRIFRAFYGYECIWEENGRTYELIGARVQKEKPVRGRIFRCISQCYITADEITEIQGYV